MMPTIRMVMGSICVSVALVIIFLMTTYHGGWQQYVVIWLIAISLTTLIVVGVLLLVGPECGK